ncbi:RILP-like protein 1 [Galemys pyrenaicus]|uniref:RILP-like protein 1 n=1 Tax=Galemys pyrenaicus TaxID=202257 RepID=A0A8J6A655_GALPY|nr:RILP-like protein 1 [Galemys pyrenaicus]
MGYALVYRPGTPPLLDAVLGCRIPLTTYPPPASSFSFFSRDKKRLSSTQRNVHVQETFGQWANSHRDDGHTEQGQEALQHL